ncbi:MAG: 5'-3' exonuclease H3TH domain-containing protein [Granulosicoccus sp.]
MIVLVDSSIYIFRAWQTIPLSVRNRFDAPDNAVQGLAETLCRIVEQQYPDFMVCAFDECYRQGVRNRLYPPYKADRPAAPEDLSPQFARSKQLAKAMGIATFGSDQVEADDIIGQFALLAQSRQVPVTIVSGDKDLVQFLTPHDRYWDLGRQAMASYDDVCKRFNIRPDQIADWLALSGDKSDNIPGVPGVGASTAARLLRKWENLDTLFANLGEVAMMRFRGATRVSRLIFEHKQSVLLARSLTGLIRDERLPESLSELRWNVPEPSQIHQSLYDLGFPEALCESLTKRIERARKRAADG